MFFISFILFFILAFVLVWLLIRKDGDNTSRILNAEFKLGPLLNRTLASLGARSGTRIVFNGKEYSSLEEMPPDARQAYDQAMGTVLVDADRNGIPDILEGAGSTTLLQTGLFANTFSDPAEKLKKLKEMRDSGLITTEEYDAKKSEILSRM